MRDFGPVNLTAPLTVGYMLVADRSSRALLPASGRSICNVFPIIKWTHPLRGPMGYEDDLCHTNGFLLSSFALSQLESGASSVAVGARYER